MQFPGLMLVQSELTPQINPPDLLIGRQEGGSAAPENDPAVHNVGAVGNTQRLPDVMVGNEHTDAAIP